MKKLVIIACAAFIVMSAFVSLDRVKSGIHGTIDPPDGAKKVWAISGADSVSTVPLNGKFSMEVKPGTWKLIVEAVAPYKNTMIDNILVQEGQPADAGIIKLSE